MFENNLVCAMFAAAIHNRASQATQEREKDFVAIIHANCGLLKYRASLRPIVGESIPVFIYFLINRLGPHSTISRAV